MTTFLTSAGIMLFGFGLYWVWLIATSDDELRWHDLTAATAGAVLIVAAMGG
jgi:hypothetical protein